MADKVTGIVRSMISAGIAAGEQYNAIYSAIREAGHSVVSNEFASAYRYAQSLSIGFVDFRGGKLDNLRDVVPTAQSIIEADMQYPDKFNARVAVYGMQRGGDQPGFARKWVNIGFGDRFPTFGTIADLAMTLTTLGESDPQFTPYSVSGVIVERSQGF